MSNGAVTLEVGSGREPSPARPQGGTPMVKRNFNREFKLQVARQLARGEKGLAQLCREHGLCQTLVRRWRDQYEQLGEHAWPDTIHPVEASALDPAGRIAELEEALGRAHLEIELLRRALEKGGLLPRRNGR